MSDYKLDIKDDNDDSMEENKILKEVVDYIKIIAFAFVIAYVLTHFVIVNAKVPTGSMNNTIETGSRIIGNRISYKFSDPERFDIAIFKAPDSPKENYVKRIIGLPGEHVVIDKSEITITLADGSKKIKLNETYLKEKWTENAGPYTFNVPKDSYLMLGDNRNNSNDARLWTNKYVSKDVLLGKVEFEYFPSLKWFGTNDYKVDRVTE